MIRAIEQEPLDPNQLSELFGCYRQFGHPTVDEVGGAQKQKERVRQEKGISEEVLLEIEGARNHSFII